MKTISLPKQAEFVHSRPANRILLENSEEGVIIRAMRDNFSPARKLAFIHEMAAEGFIPDHYEWTAGLDVRDIPGLTWLIDASWVYRRPATVRLGSRQIRNILFASGVLWLVLMLYLFAAHL